MCRHYFVDELPLDERPGDVRADFFGLNLPEVCFPRGVFFGLLPARLFGVAGLLCH
jgi:hypothetical protein